MQEEELLFLLLKAAVWFLACFYHVCVRKSRRHSSPATFLELSLSGKFAGPGPSQGVISLWTSQRGQRAPQASWRPDSEWAPPWTPSVCPSPAPSSHASESVSCLPAPGATERTCSPSSRGKPGLTSNEVYIPALGKGPLFQVCAFCRYSFSILGDSLMFSLHTYSYSPITVNNALFSAFPVWFLSPN